MNTPLQNFSARADQARRNIEQDISPNFARYSDYDKWVGRHLIKHDKSPEAIRFFARHHKELTSYAYWFYLSTLWVSYTGWSDLSLWKQLFSSPRKNRKTSLMKPSEVAALAHLPEVACVYRAHRPEETDWIAYTLSFEKACEFAARRRSPVIRRYDVDKEDILALFLRRGEFEVLVLDRNLPRLSETFPVLYRENEPEKEGCCP